MKPSDELLNRDRQHARFMRERRELEFKLAYSYYELRLEKGDPPSEDYRKEDMARAKRVLGTG